MQRMGHLWHRIDGLLHQFLLVAPCRGSPQSVEKKKPANPSHLWFGYIVEVVAFISGNVVQPCQKQLPIIHLNIHISK